MDLDRVAAVIRPRSPWEAVDLGFGMVRAWWKPVWAGWLATVAPAWWLVFGLTWGLTTSPLAALCAVWWLRPFFDRIPLYVVSRHLFGTSPSVRDALRDLPRLWTRHFWAGLVAQRLDPGRSFDLPVWELEGLRGGERKLRTALLQRQVRSSVVWLTCACWALEGFAVVALLELAEVLTPSSGWSESLEMYGGTAGSGEPTAAFWWGLAAASFLALTAIEPFYVAAGFSLYLSRRIHLEGWDIELAFRRLATRLSGGPPQPRRTGKTLAALLCLSLALPPGAARAAAPGGEPPSPAQAIQEVLKEPEFQTRKTTKVWRPVDDGEAHSPDPAQESPPRSPRLSLGFLRPVVLGVAALLVAGLVALAIGAMLRRPRRPASTGDEASIRTRTPLPTALFGLDVRPESLPEDIPAAAWSAWERGEPVLALGLLYRSALACLVHRDGLGIRESWTEGDCLAFVERQPGRERAHYFRDLTRAWQGTVYAHRPPPADAVQTLCSTWRRHFGGAPA